MKKKVSFSGKPVKGVETIATIHVKPHMYINAHIGNNGVWDDKTPRNRKCKAAQKERNALKRYIG